MKKKVGIGSLSLGLALLAFVWGFEIMGFCLGDSVLATLNIPTWSNAANASGTHYTIFYSLLFAIPAIPLALKYKNDSLSHIKESSAADDGRPCCTVRPLCSHHRL